MTHITIGADISNDHIDLHSLPDGGTLKVANDRNGFTAILKWIGTKDVERIVYELTTPCHKALESFMIVQGLALAKVNPRCARRFAEAIGRLAKTDRIDAGLLARYGALLEPRILEAELAGARGLNGPPLRLNWLLPRPRRSTIRPPFFARRSISKSCNGSFAVRSRSGWLG